jgi:DNA mismatch repair protein MutS
MNFIIDRQTSDDLNLLGKHKLYSIYNLFNRVQTIGGEKLLDQLFNHPLTDFNAINERAGIFKYFQQLELTFPPVREDIRTMENYLNTGCQKNKLTAGISLLQKKISKSLLHDEQYDLLISGIQASIRVLNTFYLFIAGIDTTDNNNSYLEKLREAERILNSAALTSLRSVSRAEDLSLLKVLGYHHLLNVKLQTDIRKLTESIYFLDVSVAVGNVARQNDLSYAKASPADNYELIAENLRHLAIDKAVGNPVSFHADNNLLFLTGANMAGKSTFMKSFGIAIYLAHMGFPVAAKNMRFSVKDGMYSSINVPDNLKMGYSHFYAEVLRVKTVAEEVSRNKNLVVIFDELFKGTNVKDAYDATLAVTEALAKYKNCFFIISTHITEVGEALKDRVNNVRFRYLPTLMDGVKPIYTYCLTDGISTDRHGMRIIENEGIFEILNNDESDTLNHL